MKKPKFLILLLLCSFSTALLAQTKIVNPQGVSIYYSFNDSLSRATVVAPPTGESYAASVAIPEMVSYDGKSYEVSRIADEAFINSKSLLEISIPRTITHIGGHAFKNCDALKVVNYNANNCVSAAKRKGGKIYPAFEDCKSIVELNFGDDVVNIPKYAFWGCTGITEITIPDNVKHVGGAAFMDCAGIVRLNFNAIKCLSMCSKEGAKIIPAFVNSQIYQINFGPFVTAIPDYAFFGCKTLTSITIPESITMLGGAAFRDCPNLTSVIYNASQCAVAHSIDGDNLIPSFNNDAITHVKFGQDVVRIPDFLFWGCKGISDIVFADNVEHIGVSAFWGCQGLRSVTISESITTIGGNAFGNCSNLNTLYFNSINCVNVTTHESNKPVSAFANGAITQVVFGNEVKRIPDYAFADCKNVASFTIPESVEYIGYKAFFNCQSLQSITIPEHVNSIGGKAFAGCDQLNTVHFRARRCAGVTKIEDGKHFSAFQACKSIKSVLFSDSVEIIPDYIFAECEAIERIVVPRMVKTIGANSFSGCNSLKQLVFNAENCQKLTTDSSNVSVFSSNTLAHLSFGPYVKNIPDYAFVGCDRLATIALPASLEKIGKHAFDGCINIKKIVIPENVKFIGAAAFGGCRSLKSLNFNAKNCLSMGENSDTMFIGAFHNAEIATISFGETVESVPDYAFYNNHSIQKITLNKSMKRIGKFAFAGIESLDYITLPEGLETIGGGAFADCENLISVYFNAINLTSSISILADTVCYPFVGKNKLENIVIGKKVTAIPEGMFYNAQFLEELVIPKTMKSLGGMSFAHCPKLTTIYFEAVECMTAASEINGTMRSAFEECDELFEVEFHKSVAYIPDYLFYNCWALTRVTLPLKASRIGNFAFAKTINLAKIILPKNITAIGEGAFSGAGLGNISISEFVTEIGDGAFDNCKQLKAIRVKKQNEYYKIENGILVTYDGVPVNTTK